MARPKAKARPPCKNCGGVADKWRGLCCECYYQPDIRRRFPSKHTATVALELGEEEGQEPVEATSAMPGSEEKVAVMEARVSRGEKPFHRGDVTILGKRSDECERERIEPRETRDPYSYRKTQPRPEVKAKTRPTAPVKERPTPWVREERTGQWVMWEAALEWKVRRLWFLGRRW